MKKVLISQYRISEYLLLQQNTGRAGKKKRRRRYLAFPLFLDHTLALSYPLCEKVGNCGAVGRGSHMHKLR